MKNLFLLYTIFMLLFGCTTIPKQINNIEPIFALDTQDCWVTYTEARSSLLEPVNGLEDTSECNGQSFLLWTDQITGIYVKKQGKYYLKYVLTPTNNRTVRAAHEICLDTQLEYKIASNCAVRVTIKTACTLYPLIIEWDDTEQVDGDLLMKNFEGCKFNRL